MTRFLHTSWRVLSVALLLWAVLVVGWSYPHPRLMLLGTIAAAGAVTAVAGVWRLRQKPRQGAVLLTVGSGVCLVLLSWSPPAAIASLILLVAGVILWGRTIRREPPRGPGGLRPPRDIILGQAGGEEDARHTPSNTPSRPG